MELALNQSQFDEGVTQCMATLQEIISKVAKYHLIYTTNTNIS
jgi:hypothetical protein